MEALVAHILSQEHLLAIVVVEEQAATTLLVQAQMVEQTHRPLRHQIVVAVVVVLDGP